MAEDVRRAYWLRRLRSFQRRTHDGFTVMQWADMTGTNVFEMWKKITDEAWTFEERPVDAYIPNVGEYDRAMLKQKINSMGVLRRPRHTSLQEVAGIRELPIRYGRTPDGYDPRSKTFKWKLYPKELPVGHKRAAGK